MREDPIDTAVSMEDLWSAIKGEWTICCLVSHSNTTVVPLGFYLKGTMKLEDLLLNIPSRSNEVKLDIATETEQNFIKII